MLEVWNHGMTRNFSVLGMNIEIFSNSMIQTEDLELAEGLAKFDYVDYIEHEEQIDYISMKRTKLMKICAKNGIGFKMTDTKLDLVELLEGDGTTKEGDE